MQTQLKKAGESMDRRLEHMRTEFSEIRAGRANPAVLDKVKVDYYGAPTPVKPACRSICYRGKNSYHSAMGCVCIKTD